MSWSDSHADLFVERLPRDSRTMFIGNANTEGYNFLCFFALKEQKCCLAQDITHGGAMLCGVVL